MMNKKILGYIFQAPLVLMVIVSFLASIYAGYKKIQGVSYAPAVILAIIVILYFIGSILKRKKDSDM